MKIYKQKIEIFAFSFGDRERHRKEGEERKYNGVLFGILLEKMNEECLFFGVIMHTLV